MRARIALAGWVGVGLLAACNTILPPSSTPTPVATATHFRTWTPVPTLTPSATLTPSLTPTITPTVPTPTLSVNQMTDAAAVVDVSSMTWVDDLGDHPMPWRFWSFSFYEPLAGWVTGQLPSAQWVLGHTVDGGHTWHAAAMPKSCEAGWVATIVFRSAAVGWARCQEVFWSTADGGQTWHAEEPAERLIDFGRTPAGLYWAVVERSDGVHLFELNGARMSEWKEWMVLPQEWRLNGRFEPPRYPVVVGDSKNVWVYAAVLRSDGSALSEGWRTTRDGGQHWGKRDLPCGIGVWGLDTGIALAPDGTLWSQCWGMSGGTYMFKSFWQSDDDGLTWREIARTPPIDSVLPTGVAALPPQGILLRLDVFDSRFAYGLLHRVDGPAITRDGGASWHTPWLGSCLQVDGAPSGGFFDDHHGYFASLTGMARTADGGITWECLEYPPTPQDVSP